jgi:acetoin utilization deacetylase AcuC-like enzyme
MIMATGFVFDERYTLHDTGPGHPERPDRIRAIGERLRGSGIWDRLSHIEALPAAPEAIERVHPVPYIRGIEAACAAGRDHLDADTALSAQSYEIALLAAGGTLAACDAVMRGEVRNAFAAVRPPGHHAERDRAMGFCLFNNVVVAARHLQGEHGVGRVLILDWDVHHGNGTQHILEEDPTVYYISLHQWPLYPGTGAASERGRGAGEGFTLNLPIPAGCGDDEYMAAFEEAGQEMDRFAPEFILISAGFDAHRRDPLAGMRVTEDGFRRMARRMLDLAAKHCGGRLVAVLEGGYDLDGLSGSVEVCLEEMLKEE